MRIKANISSNKILFFQEGENEKFSLQYLLKEFNFASIIINNRYYNYSDRRNYKA